MARTDSEAAIAENLLTNSDSNDRPHTSDQTAAQPVAISDWSWCGARVPKNQVTYMAQVVLVYAIIAVSLSQLILQSSDRELWLILLSTSVGYVLPSPRLKFLKRNISVTSAAATATATTTKTATPSPLPFPVSTVKVADTNESLGGIIGSDSEAGKDQMS